jgi:hypothetical protein
MGSRPDDKAGSKSGGGEGRDRQNHRPDQDDVLAGNKRLPRGCRHVRQFLGGDLYAPEFFACFRADHDIDIRAVETRAQQSTNRGIEHVTRAKDTRDLAYSHASEYGRGRTNRRHGPVLLSLCTAGTGSFNTSREPPALRIVNSRLSSAACRQSVL